MNNFPKHWQVKKLGEICENISAGGDKPDKFSLIKTDEFKIPIYSNGIKDDGLYGYTNLPTIDKKAVTISARGTIGFVCIRNEPFCPIVRLITAIPDNKILNLIFLAYALKYKIPFGEGSSIPQLTLPNFRQIEILLPPLDEQNLIVKKIESCFEKIDLAISNFKKSKELIEIYKQSVLSHAFNGKLTNSNLNSWQVKKLCDNSDIMTGSTPPKNEPKFYGNEYPFFKPTDLNDGYLVKFARDNLSEAGKQISRQLPPKSVLVTCIGATIGKTGLIRVEGSCNQQINAIVPKENLLPEYVYFYVISAQFQNLILENASSTTLPILNKSKFEALPILLPPLSEQNLIVAQIEKRFKAADNALNLIEQNLKKAEILKQSILSKAFNGELIKDKNE